MRIHCFVSTLLVSASLLALGSPSVRAAERIYTPPEIPEGTAIPSYAAPRDDWYPKVQALFDKTQGKQYDIIFDGDSITEGWLGQGKEVWAKNYANLNAVDFGVGGDKTQNVLWRLSKGQVDGMNPKLVVLLIGTNNLAASSNEQIADGIKAIVDEYLKRCPAAHILLLSVFPRHFDPGAPVRQMITEINLDLASLKENPRVTVLDLGPKFLNPDGSLPKDIWPDGLHPNAKGYEIWADAMRGEIEKYVPAAKK